MPASPIDYEALLKKYISHVATWEGIDFISYWKFMQDVPPAMSEEDMKALFLVSGRSLEEFEAEKKDYNDTMSP